MFPRSLSHYFLYGVLHVVIYMVNYFGNNQTWFWTNFPDIITSIDAPERHVMQLDVIEMYDDDAC